MNERVEPTGGNFLADTDEEGVLQRYQTLLDTLDDGIYQLDPKGHFVAVNDRIVDATGYDRAELLGSHVSLVLDDTEINRIEREIRDLLKTNSDSVATLELPVQTESGETIICELRLNLLKIDGEFRGTVGVARDITDRKQREQALEQDRELLDRVFEASPIGITTLAPDGEVITLNERTVEMFGLDPNEQVRTYEASEWEVYDSDDKPIPPPERPFAQVVETGEPVTDFEAQVKRRDTDDRVWVSINAAPVFDSEDELSMVTLTCEDISAVKGREHRLQRERAQTEKLLQMAPVAIAVQNSAGETVMANQRAQDALGLSEEELIEEPDNADEWTIYDTDDEPLADDETPSARALATGEPVFDEEIAIEPPAGKRMWFSINAAPLFGSNGAIDRVITTGEEITELKNRKQQLEQRKTELETELGGILARISDAFYALDEEWCFTHLNDQAAEIMGYSRDELLGRKLWQMFPDAADIYREEFEKAMNMQEPVTFEVYPEELDAWLEFNAYPSESGLSIYFRDVTERKAREQELVKYETIVETVNDGIYVKDDEGRFTMVNDAYAELTGYDRDELVGAHASLVVDEDAVQQSRELEAGITEGTSDNPTMEAMLQTADGCEVPAEGTFATFETSDGEQKQVGVVRDITERKERERQLEESERRYRTLAEHFPGGAVGVYDHDLRYTLTEGAVLGDRLPSPDTLEGDRMPEIFPSDTVEDLEPLFRAAIEEGTTDSTLTEFGGQNWRVWATPLRDADGEIFAGLSFAQDITEQVEREQRLEELIDKLEESNERLEQFAYAASHDLQEPLRMVSSYLQMIERRYAEELDEVGQEFIEFAVDGADRMRDMIEGLLQYSRVETQGDEFEPVDLDSILGDIRETLQMKVEEHDAEITAESLPRIKGDKGQLRQVFQNLLSNAIDYSGNEPPRIQISAEENGMEWIVSVTDEGIGIDSDDQERIFEIFQRVHGNKEYSGTGIGLALCERIVERHGGEIWVDSEPGEGSTFSFTLPAVQERTND